MQRSIRCVSLVFYIAALMGADFNATQLQREIGELLNLNLGLELRLTDTLGEEYSFPVTNEAVKALENLRDSATPVEIPNTNDLAGTKSDAFKGLGFIPRKAETNDQGLFKLDVTDVTIKRLKGKRIVIMADGTVKIRTPL